jgi:hypothetical protein
MWPQARFLTILRDFMYIWANSGVFGSFTPCAITPIFRPRKRMASHSIRFISRRHSLRNRSLRFISRRHSLPNHSLRHSPRQSFTRQSLPVSMGSFKPWYQQLVCCTRQQPCQHLLPVQLWIDNHGKTGTVERTEICRQWQWQGQWRWSWSKVCQRHSLGMETWIIMLLTSFSWLETYKDCWPVRCNTGQ